MYQQGDLMDIHILYEHEEREIYNAYLIKFELEKRGYDVKISRTTEPRLPFFNAPKLILTPWLFTDMNVDDLKIGYIKRIPKILNLQYEQVMSQMWLDVGYHVSSGKAMNANFLCWGYDRKQVLLDNNIPNENIVVIGDIRQDFTKPVFRKFFKTKKQLSEEFDIPEDHEWNLFISSFSFATPTGDSIKYLNNTIGESNSKKWHEISSRSQKMLLKWIEQFVRENPLNEFIYRPHPSELKETDYSYLQELKEKYDNFHFIFKYSVQDWILCSDYINSWISTSIVECYSLNKVCNILRPIKIDEYFDIPFYINAEQICDYDLFAERNLSKENSKFPIKSEEILIYYENMDDDVFIYKKICDYIEELVNDDSISDFYRHGPIIDNLQYVFKKITNLRIFPIFRNLINNYSNHETESKKEDEMGAEKLNILKKIVNENF